MSIKKVIASHWLPASVRAEKLTQLYLKFVNCLYLVLSEKKNPKSVQEILNQTSQCLGTSLAKEIAAEIESKGSFEDAVEAYKIGCKVLGIPCRTEEKPEIVVFQHPKCPIRISFAEVEPALCDYLCHPTAKAIVENISSTAKLQFLKHPNQNPICCKEIIDTKLKKK